MLEARLTRGGGLRNRYSEPREVFCYESENWEPCPVYLFRKYIGLLPKGGMHSELYLQVKRKPMPNCWYNDMGLGIITVSNTVKYLCEMAGVEIDRNDKRLNYRNLMVAYEIQQWHVVT